MAGNVTTTLQLNTNTDKYSYSKSYAYTDGFVVRQEVTNADGFVKFLNITSSKSTASTIAGFKTLIITNPGQTTAEIKLTYNEFTAGDAGVTWDLATSTVRKITFLLQSGSFYFVPTAKFLAYSTADSSANNNTLNILPSAINGGELYADSGANLGAHVNATSNPFTITTDANGTKLFKVGDLIQLGTGMTTANNYREILEVQSIASTTSMVCGRALHGTDAGDSDSTNWNAGHLSGADIYFPFFNTHADSDASTLASTDAGGNFHCMNFFGYARTKVADTPDGLIMGSVSLKFFTDGGYQELGLSGQSVLSKTGLAKSTLYGFDITVDGTNTDSDTMQFTTDSSDVTWGKTSNGVLFKIQTVLDDNNIDVNVAIVNGDIRFTSLTNRSTTAILLVAPSAGETTPFGVGIIPAIGSVSSAVGARLPDDTITDRTTGLTEPNRAVMMYDNGNGSLVSGGSVKGTAIIDYDSGELSISNGLKNAEFQINGAYGSAHSGGLVDEGMLSSVSARSVSPKLNTVVEVRGYN